MNSFLCFISLDMSLMWPWVSLYRLSVQRDSRHIKFWNARRALFLAIYLCNSDLHPNGAVLLFDLEDKTLKFVIHNSEILTKDLRENYISLSIFVITWQSKFGWYVTLVLTISRHYGQDFQFVWPIFSK